jgi:hypothetical protein
MITGTGTLPKPSTFVKKRFGDRFLNLDGAPFTIGERVECDVRVERAGSALRRLSERSDDRAGRRECRRGASVHDLNNRLSHEDAVAAAAKANRLLKRYPPDRATFPVIMVGAVYDGAQVVGVAASGLNATFGLNAPEDIRQEKIRGSFPEPRWRAVYDRRSEYVCISPFFLTARRSSGWRRAG